MLTFHSQSLEDSAVLGQGVGFQALSLLLNSHEKRNRPLGSGAQNQARGSSPGRAGERPGRPAVLQKAVPDSSLQRFKPFTLVQQNGGVPKKKVRGVKLFSKLE